MQRMKSGMLRRCLLWGGGIFALFLGGSLLVLPLAHAGKRLTQAVDWCPSIPPGVAGLRDVLEEADKASHRAPDPVSSLKTEGRLPSDPEFKRSVVAKRDFPAALAMALSWRVTGNAEHLRSLESWLIAWATTYRPSFNPIDETPLGQLIEAYAIAFPGLSEEARRKGEALIRPLGEGYLQKVEANANRGGGWANNWQSHRIKLITLSAVALNDAEMFAGARDAFLRQVSKTFDGDGVAVDFKERDALHYVVYSLQPLVVAARAAQLKGEDWMHLKGSKGVSLNDGIKWLVPFAEGKKLHIEFEQSRVQFDRTREQYGHPDYQRKEWDKRKSQELFWEASTLDGNYHSLAAQLNATAPAALRACYAGR